MKSESIHPRARVVLTSLVAIIAVSIACTNRSSGSESSGVSRTIAQSTPGTPTQSQEKVPCTLSLAAAPTINGVRLGMTTDELLSLFPGSRDDAEVRASVSGVSKFGTTSVLIRPDKYRSKENFPGVREMTLRLADDRLYDVTVNFSGPEYSHVDKFVAKFVEGTNLPAVDQWEGYVGMDNQLKTLSCKEFEVSVFAGGQGGNLNYVTLKDVATDKRLKDRRAKARAQASPTP